MSSTRWIAVLALIHLAGGASGAAGQILSLVLLSFLGAGLAGAIG